MPSYDFSPKYDPMQIAGYVQQQGELGRQRRNNMLLGGYASQALSGTPDQQDWAVAETAKLDPAAAYQLRGQVDDDQDRRGQNLYNMARFLKTNYDPAKPEYAARVYEASFVPGLRRMGFEVGEKFDAARVMPVVDQVLAQFDPSAQAGTPTGYRELDMKARAAGYQPGTPEYQRFFKIAGGTEGRASSAGFGFDTFEDAQGFKRPQRNNPRTGGTEIWYDEQNRWVPLEGPASASTSPNAAPVSQDDMERDISLANDMIASGISDEQVDAFLRARGARATSGAPTVPATPSANAAVPSAAVPAVPGIGRGRRPEDEAAAKTAAEEAARFDAYTRATKAVAERESAVTSARKSAETSAEQQAGAPKRLKNYEQALSAASNVERSIDNALSQITPASTGFVGARLRDVEGSSAYDLAAEIETVKANLGFDRLQQMRDNSPTGGALGAIAIQELVALQSTIANLDPNQSPEQIASNLKRVKAHYQKWSDTVRQAMREEQQAVPQATPTTGQSAAPGRLRYNPATGRIE